MKRRRLWAVAVLPLVAWAAAGVGAADGSRRLFDAPAPVLAFPPYVAPKADGPVVVLLDEDTEPLYPLLDNAVAGEPGTVAREDRDVFAGAEAVRVTPLQKYQPNIPGWAFKVVAAPGAGEFRYVRFAWKKLGGSGVMVQLHDADKQGWGLRFHLGVNGPGWVSKSLGEKVPAEWQLVTRDLFQEFGAVTVSGIALTAMDGEAALFDHVLLGRTVADLDRATDEALGRVKPARPLGGKERDALWDDLNGPDRPKAAAALRAFLASAPDQVGYVRDRLPRPDADTAARVHKLIAELDADEFATRQRATEALIKIGVPALAAVREAAKSGSAEVRSRAERVLKRLGGDGSGNVRAARVARVLERAATPAARELLTKLADGAYGAEYAADAKAALARLAPK
jgi:hypothetical protein